MTKKEKNPNPKKKAGDNQPQPIKYLRKIACRKCGVAKGFSKKRFLFNVKKFGSVDKLLTSYLCRECRKTETGQVPQPGPSTKKMINILLGGEMDASTGNTD